ncbi:MAG: glutamate synthase subunit beta [Thermodesulfobacteriota bacterium]|nr:glutamate synthase subunit beta [Thermodesulfobacteriota bacterium]
MGKVGGFLEYKRKVPGYRIKKERLTDFKAVERMLSTEELREQAARCMECGTPFCHASGCPLGNMIPEFNELAYRGLWKEALALLLSTGGLPEFTGRLCPELCEASCVLGINDDPVTIRQIELAIIETAYQKGYMKPCPPLKRLDRRIAVVGSGPAGLAVGDALNKLGYQVTIFDNAELPGGILRYGIPDFKLEKWVVDRRVELMKEEGVLFENRVTVGEDLSYRYLHDRFHAVCLTGGSREPRDLKIPGRELDGIHFAMDYLTCQNRKNAGQAVDQDIDAAGKEVVVLGGGDTGSDCLGTALRQGAAKVSQLEIMPRPPFERPASTPWPTWPNILRKSSSHEEGGDRRWSTSTIEFLGQAGHVSQLKCIEVDCEVHSDGRLNFKPKKGTEFQISAQLVLLALGFTGPGRNRIIEDMGIQLDDRGNVAVDNNCMTSVEGIFAAGDMARGQSLIVHAIADGRKAAKGIARYLG